MGFFLAVPIALNVALPDRETPLSASLIAFGGLILLYILVIARRMRALR